MSEDKVIVCSVPCVAIKTEIDRVIACVGKKTPMRLFYWAFGGLCFFTVVVMGGLQWKILENQRMISVGIEVVKTKVEDMRGNLNYHVNIDDVRHFRNEDRINELFQQREEREKEWE
jgi:hypothetical protein